MQDAEVGTEIETMEAASQADERSVFPDDLDAQVQSAYVTVTKDQQEMAERGDQQLTQEQI